MILVNILGKGNYIVFDYPSQAANTYFLLSNLCQLCIRYFIHILISSLLCHLVRQMIFPFDRYDIDVHSD